VDVATSSALAQLAARLDALEAAGAEQETLTPNYLTIDPVTHLVGAKFTGIINALGLTLPAATSLPGSAANQVEWVRTSDGAVVAQIIGSTGGINEVVMNTETTAGSPISISVLGANSVSQVHPAQVSAVGGVANPNVQLLAGGQIRNALDSNGASDFVQSSAGPGSSIKVGDPMIVVGNANASYGPGTGDPFQNGMGSGVISDPGGRWAGGDYICRNTGVYASGMFLSYGAGGAVECSGGIINATAGFGICTESFLPSALLIGTHAALSLIPATANDHLRPQLGDSANITLRSTDTILGHFSSCWWVFQIA
jgi:hypothetical protein